MTAPSPTRRAALLAGTALFFPALALAQPAPNARPMGGQVVAGSAAIGGDAGRTIIQQSTDRAAINWQSFDVGRNQTVQFQQPATTSVTLNRVVTPNPSQIAGRITANGQVAIVNQSGVIFHQGAQIDAAGFVASTANITNEAFMRGGRMSFDQPGRPDARIENNGTITVREAGLAALVAPQVANRGVIRARMGRVVLAGAETSVVDLHGDGLLSLEVTSPVRQAPANGQALVTNTGTVTATGGTVVLTAQAVDGIVQDLVRAGGRLAANTDPATGRTGRVVVAGNGGAVRIEGRVSAQGRAAGTAGGDIQILGDRTLVDATARVNASGRAGGGTVAIGVTPNGAANRRLSQRAGIAQGAVVRADATERGNGGTVLLNSTDYTVHAGTISARGGPQGGNGGFVEVSGQRGLSLIGAIDVGAGLGGLLGTILIDPNNLTIVADGDPSVNVNPGDIAGGILGAGDPPAEAFIAAGTVGNFVGALTLEARSDLTVAAAVTKTTGDLTLTAGNNLIINAPLVLLAGDLTLNASSATSTPSIQLGALVQVSDANRITANGYVGTTNTSGRFVGGALNLVNSGTNVSLLNDNSVLTLEGMPADGGAEFRNIRSLRVTGTVGGTSNSYARIDVDGGDLTIAGSVGGGGGFGSVGGAEALLRATGSIVIEAAGSVIAPDIRMQAGYNFGTGTPDPAAAGGIQLAGTVGGFGTPIATSVELAAGTGGIVQTAGTLVTQTLSLQSGGNATFNLVPQTSVGTVILGAGVDTLGPSTVAGDLTLNSVRSNSSGVFNLSLDTLNVGGTLSLTRSSADIVQLPGSVITANRLDLTANTNGATLTNDNRIAQLGTIDVQSPFDFRNVTDLAITGPVTVRNAAAVIDVVGNADVTGSVAAQFGVTLRATGNISLAAGSVVERRDLATISSGTITLLAGYDPVAGSSDLTSPSTLTLGGRVGNAGFLTPVELGAGTGGILQTGGSLLATDLTLRSGGDALLNGAGTGTPNSVATLLGVDVAGSFVLDNGTSDLAIGAFGLGGPFNAQVFAVRTGGAVTVNPGADIVATERASFRAGSFRILPNISVPPPGSVTAPLVEIAPDANVGMAINTTSGQPFLLDPDTLGRISASTLRLGATTFDGATTTTASAIEFPLSYSFPGTLDLRATGNIFQGAETSLSAGTLTGQAGGSILLDEPDNDLPLIGDLSAGTAILLRSAASQSLAGTVSAPTITLTTGGDLIETGAGRITGGTLTLQTGGDTLLNGANAVTGLGASNVAGRLELKNSSDELVLPVGRTFFTLNDYDIQQTGNLRIDGTITGTTGRLSASGTLQVNGNSAIARTGNLNLSSNVFALNGLLQAAGTIAVQAGTSASLAGTASGSALNITSPSISFGGLNAASTPVSLFLGTGGSTSGTLDASALSVFGGAGANLFGTIAGIAGGPAAAVGRRGTSGGSLLTEPLPSPTLYLFNNCPIGVAVCTPVIVPPPPPAEGGGTAPLPPAPPNVVFDPGPFVATAVNPPLQAIVLVPVPLLVQQLIPPTPSVSLRLYRDRSEEGELAPPNIRGEDF